MEAESLRNEGLAQKRLHRGDASTCVHDQRWSYANNSAQSKQVDQCGTIVIKVQLDLVGFA